MAGKFAVLFVCICLGGRVISGGKFPILSCESKDVMNCGWSLSAKSMLISQNKGLQYDTGDGILTKNCSLRLLHFSDPTLEGTWTCWNLSSDRGEGSVVAKHKYSYAAWWNIKDGGIESEGEVSDRQIDAKIGSAVEFKCRFGTNVPFHWSRNGEPIKFGGRYRLTNTEEGLYSTDCSMMITSFQPADVGVWRCSTYSNSWKGQAQSQPFIVQHPPDYMSTSYLPNYAGAIAVHPQNQKVSVGDDVLLQCVFEQPVACAWFINDRRLNVHYRFSFTNYTGGSRSYTTDCSMKISKISWSEFGSWTCHSLGNDTHVSVSSKAAYVMEKNVDTLESKPKSVSFYLGDVTAYLTENVELQCAADIIVNNNLVNCAWLRNENPVAVGGRYAYKKSQNKSVDDCSMIIQNVRTRDEGRWMCQMQHSHQKTANFHTNLIVTKQSLKAQLFKTTKPMVEDNLEEKTLTPKEDSSKNDSVKEDSSKDLREISKLTVVNKNENEFEISEAPILKSGSTKKGIHLILILTIVTSVAACLGIIAAILLWINRKKKVENESKMEIEELRYAEEEDQKDI